MIANYLKHNGPMIDGFNLVKLAKRQLIGLVYFKLVNLQLTSLVLVLGFSYPMIQIGALMAISNVKFTLVRTYLPYDQEGES